MVSLPACAYTLNVASVLIILKVMGICCSKLSLLLLWKWDDSCVHVCCECKLNSKHTVHLIFKGKAKTRSSPYFAFHLEGKKENQKWGGGNPTAELCYCIIYFDKTIILTTDNFGNI